MPPGHKKGFLTRHHRGQTKLIARTIKNGTGVIAEDTAMQFERSSVIRTWRPPPVGRDPYALFGVERPPSPAGADLTPAQRAEAERIGRAIGAAVRTKRRVRPVAN